MFGQFLGRLQDQRCRSVSQRHERDDGAGGGVIEDVSEQYSGLRSAGISDARAQVVHEGVCSDTGARCELPGGPVREAGDDEPVDAVRGQPGLLQGIIESCLGQRAVGVLAEPLFPHPRRLLVCCAPPVKEFSGRRRHREDVREDGAVIWTTEQQSGSAIAAVVFVSAAREPGPDIGEHHKRRLDRIQCRDDRADAGAHGADHVHGQCRGLQAERTVDDVGVRPISVGRAGRGEVQALGLGCAGSVAQGETSGFDAHRGGVLVVRSDGALAASAATTERRCDLGAAQPVVGQVGAVTDKMSRWAGLGQMGAVSHSPTRCTRSSRW